MSMTPADMGSGVAIPAEDLMTGLEDFDTTDYVMPRLTINHPNATFIDNLSGKEFATLNVILLGLVKQRILWDDEVGEGDKPLCKSLNFTEGHPDADRFPWKVSGFDRNVVPVPDTGGLVLPCQACALKEWGTNPRGSTPWCSEQHTFPLLMEVEGGGGFSPALLTVQRTGIKPSKTYLTAFARSKTPTYTCFTRLSLQGQKKGSVNYAVPIFVKGGDTDQTEWPYYAQQYRQIREFITAPPRREEDASASVTTTTTAAPVTAAASPDGDDDDLPF